MPEAYGNSLVTMQKKSKSYLGSLTNKITKEMISNTLCKCLYVYFVVNCVVIDFSLHVSFFIGIFTDRPKLTLLPNARHNKCVKKGVVDTHGG